MSGCTGCAPRDDWPREKVIIDGNVVLSSADGYGLIAPREVYYGIKTGG